MPSFGGWRCLRARRGDRRTVVLVLLFLRMLDEYKDLDYDRVHNPTRPLVTGEITVPELRTAMALSGVLVIVINGWISVLSVLLALLAIVYGLFLVALERWSVRIRDGLLCNLAVSYPVQITIGLYVYGSAMSTGEVRADWRVVPLLAIFACAFLHFEFARKTRPSNGDTQRLYSNIFGVTGSAVITLALGCAAVALDAALIQPWRHTGAAFGIAILPCAAATFPLFGAYQVLLRGKPCWPVGPAMGLIATLHASLILQAAVLD